jgi:hypothetical protein
MCPRVGAGVCACHAFTEVRASAVQKGKRHTGHERPRARERGETIVTAWRSAQDPLPHMWTFERGIAPVESIHARARELRSPVTMTLISKPDGFKREEEIVTERLKANLRGVANEFVQQAHGRHALQLMQNFAAVELASAIESPASDAALPELASLSRELAALQMNGALALTELVARCAHAAGAQLDAQAEQLRRQEHERTELLDAAEMLERQMRASAEERASLMAASVAREAQLRSQLLAATATSGGDGAAGCAPTAVLEPPNDHLGSKIGLQQVAARPTDFESGGGSSAASRHSTLPSQSHSPAAPAAPSPHARASSPFVASDTPAFFDLAGASSSVPSESGGAAAAVAPGGGSGYVSDQSLGGSSAQGAPRNVYVERHVYVGDEGANAGTAIRGAQPSGGPAPHEVQSLSSAHAASMAASQNNPSFGQACGTGGGSLCAIAAPAYGFRKPKASPEQHVVNSFGNNQERGAVAMATTTTTTGRSTSAPQYLASTAGLAHSAFTRTVTIGAASSGSGSTRTLTLRNLKELLESVHESKLKHDKRAHEARLPRETLAQHLLTFLNNRYGLKALVHEYYHACADGRDDRHLWVCSEE